MGLARGDYLVRHRSFVVLNLIKMSERESKSAAIEVFDGRQDSFDCDLAAGAGFSLHRFEAGYGL